MPWLKLDERWHASLLAGCTNARLMTLVGDLRRQIQRYELIYMNLDAGPRRSQREHLAIAEAHTAGRTSEALDLLRAHWHRGMTELLQHFE